MAELKKPAEDSAASSDTSKSAQATDPQADAPPSKAAADSKSSKSGRRYEAWALFFASLSLVLLLGAWAAGVYFWQINEQRYQLLSSSLQSGLAARERASQQLSSDIKDLSLNLNRLSAAQAASAERVEGLAERVSKVRPLADTQVWQIGQLIYLADRERMLGGDSATILQLLQRSLQYLPIEAIGAASLREALQLDIDNYSDAALSSDAAWLQQLSTVQGLARELRVRAADPVYQPPDMATDANDSWRAALEQSWLRLQSLVTIETSDQSLPLLLNQQQSLSVQLLLQTNLNQAGLRFNRGDNAGALELLDNSLQLIALYAPSNGAAESLAAAIEQLIDSSPQTLPALNSLSSFAIWSQQQ